MPNFGGDWNLEVRRPRYCYPHQTQSVFLWQTMDYLHLSHLHSQGLVQEPALPTVCDLQKNRFEKMAKYCFSGDSVMFILD